MNVTITRQQNRIQVRTESSKTLLHTFSALAYSLQDVQKWIRDNRPDWNITAVRSIKPGASLR